MTNEELRTKIVEILEETEYEWTEEKNGYILQIFYEKLADALIVAGIGDVSELKKHRVQIMKDGTIQQFYSGKEVEQIVKERDEYKHRAEVTERALCNALNDDSCYFCNKKSPCECEHRDWGSKECITVLLRQAEKELAEDGKE